MLVSRPDIVLEQHWTSSDSGITLRLVVDIGKISSHLHDVGSLGQTYSLVVYNDVLGAITVSGCNRYVSEISGILRPKRNLRR